MIVLDVVVIPDGDETLPHLIAYRVATAPKGRALVTAFFSTSTKHGVFPPDSGVLM
jgi:hypothetical protein